MVTINKWNALGPLDNDALLTPKETGALSICEIKAGLRSTWLRGQFCPLYHGIHEVQRHVPGHRHTEGENGSGSAGFEAKTQQGTQ